MTARTLEWIWVLFLPPIGFVAGLAFRGRFLDGVVTYAVAVSVMQFGLLLKDRADRTSTH